MISFLHLVRWTLWALPLLLQSAIVVVMMRRSLERAFPMFFTYTVVVLSRDVILLFLRYPGKFYSLLYWYGEAFAVALGLAVVFEILRHALPRCPSLRIVFRSVWILGGLAAVAAVSLLVFSNGSTGNDRVLEMIILLERAARFLQVFLLLIVIALMSRLGLTWHHYSVGILAGFGIYSALDLAALELRAHLHYLSDNAFVLIRPAAYNFGAIIWAAYFLRPLPIAPPERLPNNDFTEWNEVLTQYIQRWYRRY